MTRAYRALPPAVLALVVGCRSMLGPTATTPLPLVHETATARYYHEPGDTIDVEWQEQYATWALERLGLQPGRPIEYRKYHSRYDMGRYTGAYSWDGFAEVEHWRVHTVWPRDNHEVIHLYSALIGRPSDFFNEGIAVSLQADPVAGRFAASFGGDVHEHCRRYLAAGLLPLPLSSYVTTKAFRALPDSTLSYRYAGSFTRWLWDTHGRDRLYRFFASSTRDDSATAIGRALEAAYGRSLAALQVDWLEFLRAPAS